MILYRTWAWLMVFLTLTACDEKTEYQSAHDSPCVKRFEPFHHTVCSFGKDKAMFLYWQGDDKKPLLTFDRLIDEYGAFDFAMNAGMYDGKFAPIGLTMIDGQVIKTLNTKEGAGNFHLMPNGVFWWHDGGVFVDTTPNFIKKQQQGVVPKYATQSGPMLVIDGDIHDKFDPNSPSKKMRNGVGVDCQDGRTHFVITDTPVNFYEFADVFKSVLTCQNALFLDGGIASALYAKDLNRHDRLNMAVMIAVR